MKTCTLCLKEKDENEFSKHKNYPDGLQYWCKKCQSETKRKAYASNLEENRKIKREYQKQYRKNNVELFRKKGRLRYRENKDKMKAERKAYRDKNVAKINRKQILNNRLRGTPGREGYVYVMRFPYALSGKHYYKIGLSALPSARLEKISSHSPVPVILDILIKTNDMALLESDLHHFFKDKRVNREWFCLTKRDIDTIMAKYIDLIIPPGAIL